MGSFTKSSQSSGKKQGPITLSLGDDPMMMGMGGPMSMGDPDQVRPQKNVNSRPEFIAAKEAQYATCMDMIGKEIEGDPFRERAYGCILGALTGDACGSYLEFDESFPSDTKLENCMKMPGGGYFGCAPGQPTDDGEMMMCLMIGYVQSNEGLTSGSEARFDFEKVAGQYRNWYASDPFDMGQATETSIKTLMYAGKTAQDAIDRARTFNAGTKSNGSLMRCMPHAIFAANMVKEGNYEGVKQLVAGEAGFVHANPIVHEAIFVYIVSLAHLMNSPESPGRAQEAFDLALQLSEGPLANTVDHQYGESVNKWLKEAQSLVDESNGGDFYLRNVRRYNVIKQMGFIKHAIVLSYYFLLMAARRECTYHNTIKEIVGLAGDTDTNACIAGGMMGALVGFKGLDEQMVRTTLACDVTGEGNIRPAWLSVGKTAVANIAKLIDCRAGSSYTTVNAPQMN